MTRDEIMRCTTCGDCLHYVPAPEKWTTREFGFCTECESWEEADTTLWHTDCEFFEARAGFTPQPDDDWEDYSEWDD